MVPWKSSQLQTKTFHLWLMIHQMCYLVLSALRSYNKRFAAIFVLGSLGVYLKIKLNIRAHKGDLKLPFPQSARYMKLKCFLSHIGDETRHLMRQDVNWTYIICLGYAQHVILNVLCTLNLRSLSSGFAKTLTEFGCRKTVFQEHYSLLWRLESIVFK